jgi:hypothetical protein
LRRTMNIECSCKNTVRWIVSKKLGRYQYTVAGLAVDISLGRDATVIAYFAQENFPNCKLSVAKFNTYHARSRVTSA